MADRTIYIGNVASDADEYTLRSIFETCGQVTQIRIAGKKGLNTVYCFVEFADASQAYSALAMNGLPVGDRQIRVSMAKTGLSQPSTPSSPSPLPPYEVLAAQAQAHMMSGPGFMMQPTLGHMQPNLGPLPGMPPGMMPLPPIPPPGPKPQRRPHQDPSRVGRTVYLENVAADIDEQVLAEYFSACGDVVAVRLGEKTVPQQLTIKAWIEFRSQHAARTAREYDQTMLQGSAIRVRSSKTAIHTNGLAPPRLTPNSSPGRPSQSLHNLPLDPSHSPPTLPHPHKGPGT
ncbi:hypothetical protein WJX74_010616 [Apatococcus lobatus]|uniref:RRM domain-containing protein n=1 Tax=Apatococcus lobatus TaxID=904363 RepID=A0AAW1RZ68_9CHLO